jgi:hypothetical protein
MHARAHILKCPQVFDENKAEELLLQEAEEVDQRQEAQNNCLSKTRLQVEERGLHFCRKCRIYWFVLAHSL